MTAHTSVGTTSYLLLYGMEAVIPGDVEIPSLRIIVKSEIEDTEWVKTHLEQLMLIDEKRLAAVCFDQLYQQIMTRAYNKKVCPRHFEIAFNEQPLRRISTSITNRYAAINDSFILIQDELDSGILSPYTRL
nr:uncharacterized protein LOC117276957 [Nicotiana tomentosiformis]